MRESKQCFFNFLPGRSFVYKSFSIEINENVGTNVVNDSSSVQREKLNRRHVSDFCSIGLGQCDSISKGIGEISVFCHRTRCDFVAYFGTIFLSQGLVVGESACGNDHVESSYEISLTVFGVRNLPKIVFELMESGDFGLQDG